MEGPFLTGGFLLLSSILLQLRNPKPVQLPQDHYRYVHAAFFRAIRQVSPEAAEQLHRHTDRKPFTVSLLQGGRRSGGYLVADMGQQWTWRITSLEANLSSFLLAMPWSGMELWFGRENFRVEGLIREEVYATSLSEIVVASMFEPAPAFVEFEFQTPTTFRYYAKDYPMPTARLVWKSLRDAWLSLGAGEINIPDLFLVKDLSSLKIIPAEWEGKTCRVTLSQEEALQCFTGRFRYDLRLLDEDSRFFAGLLARFSFFSGVGRLTTHGLGQVYCTLE